MRGGSRKQEPALLLNSYDPANLWGPVLPLSRCDGSRQAMTRIPSTQALFNRPPALRPVRRIEVQTWDGAPVRASEAVAPLLAAGFYPDGPRLLWDGYPGPRPRS